jgi:organic radical activating enzyme
MYCALVHNGAYINNNSEFKPCCNVVNFKSTDTTPIINEECLSKRLNDPKIVKIREQLSQDVWPSECKSCSDNELQGIPSLRQIHSSRVHAPESIKSVLTFDDIYLLHLGTGNKCNSKCMTCHPHSSNLWKDEFEYIHDIKVTKKYVSVMSDINYTMYLATSIKNIQQITFIGGEPTIEENYEILLDYFVKNNLSKNMHIEFVTNLTNIENIAKYLASFREVTVIVSIDGVGPINDYIRYPIKWEKVKLNLSKLLEISNVNTCLSLTPSAFNCIHLDQILKFWKEITNSEYPSISFNNIDFPKYARMDVLPLTYRKVGIEKLELLKSQITSQHLSVLIDKLIIELSVPQTSDIQQLEILRKFIKKSDIFRNRNIKFFIPELYEELFPSENIINE